MLLPLGKEQVLLKQYRHNLANWRDSVDKQYHEALDGIGHALRHRRRDTGGGVRAG